MPEARPQCIEWPRLGGAASTTTGFDFPGLMNPLLAVAVHSNNHHSGPDETLRSTGVRGGSKLRAARQATTRPCRNPATPSARDSTFCSRRNLLGYRAPASLDRVSVDQMPIREFRWKRLVQTRHLIISRDPEISNVRVALRTGYEDHSSSPTRSTTLRAPDVRGIWREPAAAVRDHKRLGHRWCGELQARGSVRSRPKVGTSRRRLRAEVANGNWLAPSGGGASFVVGL